MLDLLEFQVHYVHPHSSALRINGTVQNIDWGGTPFFLLTSLFSVFHILSLPFSCTPSYFVIPLSILGTKTSRPIFHSRMEDRGLLERVPDVESPYTSNTSVSSPFHIYSRPRNYLIVSNCTVLLCSQCCCHASCKLSVKYTHLTEQQPSQLYARNQSFGSGL